MKPTSTTAQQSFKHVSDMEEPLWTVKDMLHAISLLASKVSPDDAASAIWRLATVAHDKCDDVERLRCKLFEINHANPDGLEKETGHDL